MIKTKNGQRIEKRYKNLPFGIKIIQTLYSGLKSPGFFIFSSIKYKNVIS